MGSLVRLAAVAAVASVSLSFLLFAVDQSREGSESQLSKVEGSDREVRSDRGIDVPAPEPAVEAAREARRSDIREAVDDVNDPLVTPFAGVIDSSSIWAQRIVPLVLALLLYGVGGMLLANFIPKPQRQHKDWREAT